MSEQRGGSLHADGIEKVEPDEFLQHIVPPLYENGVKTLFCIKAAQEAGQAFGRFAQDVVALQNPGIGGSRVSDCRQ